MPIIDVYNALSHSKSQNKSPLWPFENFKSYGTVAKPCATR